MDYYIPSYHQLHCIVVSEFYAHCDVITHHLKMAVGTPSLVVQLPHVNMPVLHSYALLPACTRGDF